MASVLKYTMHFSPRRAQMVACGKAGDGVVRGGGRL